MKTPGSDLSMGFASWRAPRFAAAAGVAVVLVFAAGVQAAIVTGHSPIPSFAQEWIPPGTVAMSTTVVLLLEDFDGLAYGPSVDEQAVPGATNVWTKTAPAGWMIDDNGVPGLNQPGMGVTEWKGWSFAKREWWATVAGDQTRTLFTKSTGGLAIADPDEWDDIGNPAATVGYMTTLLKTPTISLAGVGAGSVFLEFDSSWRPEGFDDTGPNGLTMNNQTRLSRCPTMVELPFRSCCGTPRAAVRRSIPTARMRAFRWC